MERVPIVLPRKAIISRTAIYHRVACCSQLVSYQSCQLCSQYQDCQGKSYCSEDSQESSETMRVIHIDKDYENWEELEERIWLLSAEKVYLRLIIDRDIPDRILWAASYSEKNIFQMNINMIYYEETLNWVQRLMFLAGNCGLYCVLFLYPIIPDVVKSYHVLEIADNFRNTGYHHIALRFCEFTNCIEINGYINFNGTPVSTKYLTKTKTGWKCTDEYLRLFLSKIQLYTAPRKMSISICGISQDCTGLGG